MNGARSNLPASVRARLLNIAREQRSDFNQILVRFALERMLYRLMQSPYGDRFLLKGALLFTLWYDMPHRATRDADLLGFGESDPGAMLKLFQRVAAETVDDGMVFDPSSVVVDEIRKEAGYGGVRVLINGELSGARCKVQIDVGFGDAVTPATLHCIYPVLLDDLPAPRLRVYPTYTVVAEKLHAIAFLGMTNSRLKDYFDLAIVFERESLDDSQLAEAIKATFERRRLAVSGELPVGLTAEFANDPSRQSLWLAFLRKNGLPIEPLGSVIERIQNGLGPALLLLGK